jgi:hypothetical protein
MIPRQSISTALLPEPAPAVKTSSAYCKLGHQIRPGTPLNFIRIDTGNGNDRLINHYIKCVFTLLGDTAIDYKPNPPLIIKTENLP